MAHPVHVPDRTIVAALKRIDPTLSVDWMEPPGRWAIFHDLQVDGNFEESVDRVARSLQATFAENGYIKDFHDCTVLARESLKTAKLVCYVADDDGSYRSLDGRIVKKLERMDYYRQNLGIKDWQEMLRAKTDLLRAQQEKSMDDLWSSVNSDKIFKDQVSDILWGNRPMRSIFVKGVQFDGGNESAERNVQAPSGAGDGA